ncbi:MAG: hypothetical protein JO184_16105 [Gammaproteobacteria bacterium]|nr:hypothetical protein [Gammaproteobacteria bacterium]
MSGAAAGARAALLAALLLLAGGVADADEELRIGGAALRVQLDRDAFGAGAPAILQWVQRSADIVARYYGRFPAATATLRLVAQSGDGVHGGKTFANPDAYIRVQLGREVTAEQLSADWVLVHEMTHLALPDTGEEHAWLSEGLATYVEGIARVQAGNRSEADVWAEEMRSMPRGLPEPGDRGLDHTHSWGRTYWGGAMFCLLADVDIRKRTQLRFGLQQALRAILRESGGLATDWPIERVLRTGDAAVGTHTLEELYAGMKEQPVTPDLTALWRELGVMADGSSVRLLEDAPLAPVRRAIMRAP